MTRKTLAILLALALCLAALLAVLAARLPGWVDDRARQWLAGYGVEDYRLGGFQPGFSGTLAERLVVSGEQGDWRFRITARGLRVNYHWRTLLDGRIQTVSIRRLAMELEPAGTVAEEPGAPIEPGELVADLRALRLPLDRVRIQQLRVDIPYGGKTWQVSGRDLVLDNSRRALTGHLKLQGEPPGLPALQVTLKSGDSGDWLPRLVARLGDGEQPLARGRLTASLDADRRLELAVSGRLWLAPLAALRPDALARSQIRAPKGELGLEGRIRLPAAIDPAAAAPWADVEMALEASGDVAAEALAGGAVTEVSGGGALSLAGGPGKMEIRVAEPLRLAGRATTSLPLLEANAEGRVRISTPRPLTLSLTDGPALRAPALRAEARLGEATADLAVTNLNWRAGKSLSLETALDSRLPLTDRGLSLRVAGSVSGDGERWRGEGDYRLPDWQAAGPWRAHVDPAATAELAGQLELEDLPAVLDTLRDVVPVPGELDLKAGRVAVDYELSFSTDGIERQAYRIDLTGLDGVHGGLAFTGGDMTGALVEEQGWRSTEPLRLRMERLESGVSLTDLEARAELLESPSLKTTRWRVGHLRAGLFSGTVELAEPVMLSLPPSGTTLPFRVSGVNLADVLALYEEQGISGSGTVEGQVPVTPGPEGASIDDGTLAASNGHIAYRPGSGTGGLAVNQHLALALRLLEDFKYDRLEAEVDFTTSGDLTLAVHLFGRNPAVFDGRAVNFNINVEENLFDLFKVLRLTDDLSIELQKRLQR